MKTVFGTTRIAPLAAVVALAMVSLPAVATASTPASAPQPPAGSTRLVSTGFTIDEIFLRNADVSDGAQLAAFTADSSGGPSNINARRPGEPRPQVVSKSDAGEPGDFDTDDSAVAPDGSFVVYSSRAGNIGRGNPYGTLQVYLYDVATDTTTPVSATRFRDMETGDSVTPSVSPDSRFVVFESDAPHLAPGGMVGLGLYVYEVATGVITAVDPGTGRVPATEPVISSGGRFVAFTTGAELLAADTHAGPDVYRYDSVTGGLALVSRGSGADPSSRAQSAEPQMSADGSRVCYTSSATDLVPGDPGTFRDIYLADLSAQTTELISRASDGGWPNGSSVSCDISADGAVVVFSSGASDLVASDGNNQRDIFSTVIATGSTELRSRTPHGTPGNGPSANPAISADGRYVVFESYASDLATPDPDDSADIFITRLG